MSCGGSCGGGSYGGGNGCAPSRRAPSGVDRYVIPDWGTDAASALVKLNQPARCCYIGPSSEVDAVRLRLPGVGGAEYTVSVEHPLIDFPIASDVRVLPMRTQGLDTTKIEASAERQNFLNRLDIVFLDYVPRGPLPLKRPPRRYPRETTVLDAGGALPLLTLPVGGARAATIYLRTGNQDAEYRLVARRYDDSDSEVYPLVPDALVNTGVTWEAIAANTHISYSINLQTDPLDAIWVYGREGTVPGSLTVAAEVVD
jgi:hypothetical protein